MIGTSGFLTVGFVLFSFSFTREVRSLLTSRRGEMSDVKATCMNAEGLVRKCRKRFLMLAVTAAEYEGSSTTFCRSTSSISACSAGTDSQKSAHYANMNTVLTFVNLYLTRQSMW